MPTLTASDPLKVDYEDPRWSEVQYNAYWFCHESMQASHFPIRGSGSKIVHPVLIHFDDDITLSEFLAFMRTQDALRLPDRAETETYFDRNPKERLRYCVVGACGRYSETPNQKRFPFIDHGPKGRGVCSHILSDFLREGEVGGWEEQCFMDTCRFLAIRTAP